MGYGKRDRARMAAGLCIACGENESGGYRRCKPCRNAMSVDFLTELQRQRRIKQLEARLRELKATRARAHRRPGRKAAYVTIKQRMEGKCSQVQN